MAQGLSLDWRLNRESYPRVSQPQLVYLLVQVQGDDRQALGDREARSSVNVGLVVDASRSMHIRLVTEEQFRGLATQGALTEVMTDGVPSWRAEEAPRAWIEQLPRKIDFVVRALESLLPQLRPADVVTLVAFATDAKMLVEESNGADASALREAIGRLDKVDLGEDTYMARGIQCAWDAVVARAGSGVVSRLILLTDGFTRDDAACWQWVEQARRAGISLSTMGMGGEFNEELLIPMAERSGGNAHFIDDPDAIPALFHGELGGMQRVAQRNLELKLVLTPGVELRQLHRVKPVISLLDPGANRGGSYTVFLGDLEVTAPPALLLELIVPPREAGRFRIAQLLLSSDPVAADRSTVRSDVVLTVAGESPGRVNARVMNLVETVSAFKLHTRALAEARAGNAGAATQKLQAAATRLLDLGAVDLAQEMSRQADALSRGMEVDQNATKKLRYDTRRLTQKLDEQ